MPFCSSRYNREGVKKGFILLSFFVLFPLTGCGGSKSPGWSPLHEILVTKEYPPKLNQRKATIEEKQKDIILRWVSKDKNFIDSLVLKRFGRKIGAFKITRVIKNDDLVVRLYAPFLKEHKIYAGIQLQLFLNKETFSPKAAYLSAVPWER
jgi:hypothetical protein